MTHITIYKNSDSIVGFRSEGHAGFANAGEDIICAAISVLEINTMNSIEKFTNDKFLQHADEDNAVIEFYVTSEIISNETGVLLKAMELGLSDICKQSPDYVSINYKEV